MVYSHKIKIPIVIQSQSCRPLEKGRGKAAGWMRRSRGASTLFTQFSTLPFPRTAKACDGATAGLSIQESSPHQGSAPEKGCASDIRRPAPFRSPRGIIPVTILLYSADDWPAGKGKINHRKNRFCLFSCSPEMCTAEKKGRFQGLYVFPSCLYSLFQSRIVPEQLYFSLWKHHPSSGFSFHRYSMASAMDWAFSFP